MTADVPERPLIPQPPATVAALRQAVARITPSALPAFADQLDEAVDQARQEADFGPVWRFTTSWSIHVQIQRQPLVAARFRELEILAVESEDRDQRRAAVSELGRILDDACEAIGLGKR
ncbi:hypothetical protein [Streptomyces sp. NPDC053048]|uniref:hypothetical protein n=1 Tax=Streptomyces sp. NPDC053048 TaxID=3365694 RepID=UPI0037CD1A2F